MENIEKLPKWAQSQIKVLEMNLEYKTKELDRINHNQESNTIVGSGYQLKDEQITYLRDNQLITFRLENGYVQARIKNDCVEIHTHGGELVIRPQVSNGFQIKLIAD
jgi:hypothetical protein